MGSHGNPRDPTWGAVGSRGILSEFTRRFPREPSVGAYGMPLKYRGVAASSLLRSLVLQI